MTATQTYEHTANEATLLEQLPQVRYIAKRIHERLPKHVPFDDLLHAGILGLIDAMNKYNPGKNVRFASYAKFRIRGAILDSLREMDWSPRELRRKARRIEEVVQKLQAELGHAPSELEIAQGMGLSLEQLQHLLDDIRGLDIGSLQVQSLEDGKETDLSETIPGPPSQDPLFLFLQQERSCHLASAIAELPEREQQVLALYYQEELTMKEVGLVLGVGESRVSQVHSMAITRLRAILADRGQRKPPIPGKAWLANQMERTS